MTVFRLPKGVCQSYRSKVAKYWWGKGGTKKGIHWAKWELLCEPKQSGGLGFRDISCFNQALLAKTVWRLVLQPESLVNRVLAAKYSFEQNWANASIGSKPSLIWKSLLWGRDLLCDGMRWRIGNGEMVRIWGDKWLPTPWTFKVITPRFMGAETTVKHLMIRPGEWNISLVKANFLPVDAEKILSIPLFERTCSDVAVWHFENDGHYSVKSGYWLSMEKKRLNTGSSSVCGNSATNSANIWSIIWNLRIPHKVKLFLWRACHSFLPCAERLFKRRIGPNSNCNRCGRQNETVLHCLWDCSLVKKIWKLTWLGNFCKEWREPGFADLVCHVAAIGKDKELEFFCLMAWWIWKDRNNLIHGKRGLKAMEIVDRVTEWMNDILQAQERKRRRLLDTRGGNSTSCENQFWTAPSHSFTKLNFDGISNVANGVAGLGAVIRNEFGNLIGALAIPVKVPLKPVIAANALALWKGLEYCQQIGVRKLEIEGDAITVINSLPSNGLDLSSIGVILDGVRAKLAEFDLISWKHVNKRRNIVAHGLAKTALTAVQSWYCQEVGPPWLLDLIKAEVRTRN